MRRQRERIVTAFLEQFVDSIAARPAIAFNSPGYKWFLLEYNLVGVWHLLWKALSTTDIVMRARKLTAADSAFLAFAFLLRFSSFSSSRSRFRAGNAKSSFLSSPNSRVPIRRKRMGRVFEIARFAGTVGE